MKPKTTLSNFRYVRGTKDRAYVDETTGVLWWRSACTREVKRECMWWVFVDTDYWTPDFQVEELEELYYYEREDEL